MLLAPSALLLATTSPRLALTAFFLLFAWQNFGAGTVMVGWQDMIAKVIPVQSRGKFFGLSNFIGNFSGILGAVTVSWLLTQYEFPGGFVIAFAGAAAFNFISWVFLSLTREPRAAEYQAGGLKPGLFQSSAPRSSGPTPIFNGICSPRSFRPLAPWHPVSCWCMRLDAGRLSDGQAATYNIALLIGQSTANLASGLPGG